MPVPKVFRKFASKSTLKAGGGAVTTPDVPANQEDVSSTTLVMAAAVPTYPKNLTEAWSAAHKELPQAQGVEKFLNRVGASAIDGPVYLSILR